MKTKTDLSASWMKFQFSLCFIYNSWKNKIAKKWVFGDFERVLEALQKIAGKN